MEGWTRALCICMRTHNIYPGLDISLLLIGWARGGLLEVNRTYLKPADLSPACRKEGEWWSIRDSALPCLIYVLGWVATFMFH
jgi:hypothetical protein